MSEAQAPWTFARVLQHMADREQTGILEVTGPDGEMRLHLQDGKIVELETMHQSGWKLGDFLVESETLAENELLRANEKAKKLGVPLETMLLSLGLITEDILKRFVDLHVRESVLVLFSKTGIMAHLSKAPPVANKWLVPIPIAFLIKTGSKRAEIWPTLYKRIPHDEVTFDKIDSATPLLLGSASLPPGPGLEKIGANARIVYYYVNGKKTVRQIAYATCLGEFETYLALCSLFDAGFVELHSDRGPGEALQPKRVLLPATFRTIAYSAAGAIVALLAVIRPGALSEPAALIALTPPRLQALERQHARHRLEQALDLHLFATGEYPPDLAALVKAERVREVDLEAAFGDARPRYDRLPPPARGFLLSE